MIASTDRYGGSRER